MSEKRWGRNLRKIFKVLSFTEFMGLDDPFEREPSETVSDPYRSHSWVNICINILIRNVGRAPFLITRNGEEVTTGRIFSLFRDVNPGMNRCDLWKETAAWWFLEGEAFWFFGDDYSAGIPHEIYVLNPRKMRAYLHLGKVVRWFYSTDQGEIPLLPDELIHFRAWNPWNPHRGVSPLIALSDEINQDVRSNKSISKLLKNNSVPEGILKTDQVLREEEADKLERRWETSYGRNKKARSIAVLGKGTSFQALTVTPAALKSFDLKRWNLYTILASYGIPPRVANIQDQHSSLSGSDTANQHGAFWRFTVIPLLKNFEEILETQFFTRFGLIERGQFDTSRIPELQESEDEKSKRDIREIEAGLKTINDVLKERGLEPKPWGDEWHRNTPSDEKNKKSLEILEAAEHISQLMRAEGGLSTNNKQTITKDRL
ncbi:MULTISPECIES: phage portal protein [unclassified Oceanispirochaeta]|uniref:phage portal protein n=1 Tax=unclassified Oceanispirochaeta TaxID=2635722 RepID=UPI000E096D68|nr:MULTISPECIES: phage portal protein [unclassified Oceanispirochaeta]MBF9018625.1 phage portal protein [Oceanispirochaeta sp. M2]NPD75062.1 phage portal protein [Oceanispirochaeta sp. M1]RDG29088.1 phage portal protein [Oceanispirochaeta sp. M1]